MALLDVAKAFPSVPRTMIMHILRELGAVVHSIRMLVQIYSHVPTALHLHGRDLPIHLKRGTKEGCLLSPIFLVLYDDVVLWENLSRHPYTHLYMFVDDIVVWGHQPNIPPCYALPPTPPRPPHGSPLQRLNGDIPLGSQL